MTVSPFVYVVPLIGSSPLGMRSHVAGTAAIQ